MDGTLLLIRHAITDWHGQARVLGQNDVPLNAAGRAQADRLAAACVDIPIRRIATSPLQRASQTAEVIASRLSVPVAVDARLTDYRVGEWEGLGYEELTVRKDFLRFLADPLGAPPPGGENLEHAAARAMQAVDELRADGDCWAIVSHSDIVRLLLAQYLGLSPAHYLRLRASVASASVVVFSGSRSPRVAAINWSPSLTDSVFPAAR